MGKRKAGLRHFESEVLSSFSSPRDTAGGESGESREDVCVDLLDQKHHQFDDVLFCKRGQFIGFAKLYSQGEISAHLHLSLKRGRKTREHCIVVNVLREEQVVLVAPVRVDQVDVNVTGDDGSQHQTTVLVDVVKLVEDPQGVQRVIASRLPRVIRLQTIDECRRSVRQTIEPPQFFNLMPISSVRISDREHRLRGRCSAWAIRIAADQRVNDVVKGTTEVVDAVADQQSDQWRRIGKVGDDIDLLRVRIEFGANAAMVTCESSDQTFGDLAVLLSANDLFTRDSKFSPADLDARTTPRRR